MEEIEEFLEKNNKFENSIYEQLGENTILIGGNLIKYNSKEVQESNKISNRKRNEVDSSRDIFSCMCDPCGSSRLHTCPGSAVIRPLKISKLNIGVSFN